MIVDPTALSAEAQNLACTKPSDWEHRLFFQVLTDEIVAARPLLQMVSPVPRAQVSLDEYGSWIAARMNQILALIESLERLVNADHDDAFGPPGIPGNVENIVRFARRIAAIYRQIIDWVHSVRDADVDPRLREVGYEVSFLADPLLRAIERYGPDHLDYIEAALNSPQESHSPISARLEIQAPDVTRVERSISTALAALNDSATTSERTGPGYIYILSNPSMAGLLKIGRTTRAPRERLAELSGATGVPTPFVLAFDAYVEDTCRAEAFVHARLAHEGHRVAANREFFSVDLHRAIEVVLEAQRFVASPPET